MWLNIVFTGSACLLVGFLLGWVVGRPRRWGAFDVGGETDTDNDTYAQGA